MVRTRAEGIRVWFWQRDDPSVPSEVQHSQPDFFIAGPTTISPNPTWGAPDAEFPVGDWCDYGSHFDPHVMVFDLTFCVSRSCPSYRPMCLMKLFLRATGLVLISHNQVVAVIVWTVSACTYRNVKPPSYASCLQLSTTIHTPSTMPTGRSTRFVYTRLHNKTQIPHMHCAPWIFLVDGYLMHL